MDLGYLDECSPDEDVCMYVCTNTIISVISSSRPPAAPSNNFSYIHTFSSRRIRDWLVQKLAKSQMVRIEKPLYYSTRFKEALLADPIVLNLKERCGYFYELGLKLKQL